MRAQEWRGDERRETREKEEGESICTRDIEGNSHKKM